jgi:nucleoside-diphosphate-sugar epimerase
VVTGSLASTGAARAALEGVDVVYHLAASLKGSPADMFLNTVVTSRNLLEAAASLERPLRVVLVSSFSVYGAAALRWGSRFDETVPLEPHPEWRDPYAQVKLRQEELFREYSARHPGIALVVLRPGVIYGPAGSAFSNRVGLRLPGLFLHIGGSNPLPLSYVDNCAEAIAVAGAAGAAGEAYNVHDDERVSARRYLRLFKKQVQPVRSVFVPYPVISALSRVVWWYHRHSQGQLPALLTPYRTASMWKRARFDNAKLRSLGWRQLVSAEEGLRRTFAGLRARSAAGERLL